MDNFGLVLSGGGAKGAYQVGAFKALKEFENINIKIVSGTSIGGINAFLYVTTPFDKIVELWKNFSKDDFISLDDDWSDGLSDRLVLEQLLDDLIDTNQLQTSIPIFNTIADELNRGKYVLLNNKDKEYVKKIILATSALPIIYSPINIDNISYQDGGLADNLPIFPIAENSKDNDDFKNIIVISLSNELRVNKYLYPNCNFIEVYPTYSLGGLVDGTLNFDPKNISFGMQLGYFDTKRVLNKYFEIDNGCHTPEFDYNQIQQTLRKEKLDADINRTLDYLKKYK